MSWIHSSKGIVLGLLLALSLVAVGTAAALSVTGGTPAPAEVNETVTVSITVEDPFAEMPEQWTMRGETDLEDATWTIQRFRQGSSQGTDQAGGASFEDDLDIDSGVDEIEIEVSGEVPPLSTFNYDERQAENYTALRLASVASGNENEIAHVDGHRYTQASGDDVSSLEARQAIDAAIEAVGGKNDKIEQAISSYNNGNFENARDLASEAESGAQSSQLLVIGAGVVVLLALVGGGVYYWRERQESSHKLQ